MNCKISDKFSGKTSYAKFFNKMFLGNEHPHFISIFHPKKEQKSRFESLVGTHFTKITPFQNVTLRAIGKSSFFVLSKQKKRCQISSSLSGKNSTYIRSTIFTY